jgi:DNA polymerase III sliding clamp (beta) subunit (PCNA family)
MQSVWAESLAEHAQRLEALEQQSRKPWARSQKEEEWTPEERLLAHFHSPMHLSLARDCLECEAHFKYHTDTRMKRGRTNDEWTKASLPKNHEEFYQDARLKLVVRFDEGLMQFVPMTIEEWLAEKKQSNARHANEAAEGYIESWKTWKPCNTDKPVLFKRGTHAEIMQEIQTNASWRGTVERLRLAAEEWNPDKAILLQVPTTTAYQPVKGESGVVVQLWDGDRLIDAWEDTSPPWHKPQSRSYYVGKTDVAVNTDRIDPGYRMIVFRLCTPKLYAEHMGTPYQAEDGSGMVNPYLWESGLPNFICEVTADAAALFGSLKRVVIASSNDQTRPVLCAIALSLKADTCTLIATDTYRLMTEEVACQVTDGVLPDEWGQEFREVLLPNDFVSFCTKALKKPTGQVKIRFGSTEPEGKVGLIAEIVTDNPPEEDGKRLRFLSRCVEGCYVNWRKVIPYLTEGTIQVELDPKEVVPILKKLLTIARQDANRIQFTIDSDGTWLSCHGYDTDGAGKRIGVSDVLLQPTSANPIDTAYNGRFLLDYLKQQKDTVRYTFNSPLNSGLFETGIEGCYGYSRYVLMPMQVI